LFAGVLFLHQTLLLIKKLPRPGGEPPHDTPANPDGDLRRSGCRALGPGIIFLLITLAAVFISGCRTAFLFVLLAIVALVFSRKTASWTKVLFVGLLVVTFLVAGGTLKKRLEKMVSQAALLSNSSDLFQVVDQVSNVRLSMFRDSARMLARFPVTGVGAGNFLFYLKTLHFNERYYEDLPLNQYLLVFSETGAVGGLAFIFFLAALLRGLHPGPGRRVIAAIAIAIFFNNFFWFPECLLLFWTFLAGSDFRRTAGRKPSPAWPWMVVAVFAAFHALEFRALHPQTLTGQKGIAYDYGFWPPEKNDRGVFSWTGAAAGKYFPAANEGDFALSCAAPHGWLQKEKMNVTLFWRGKLFQRVVFTEDRFMRFQLPRRQEGFLEIRVHPTFNVKAIRLGADPRQLGVQFMEMKKPLP